MAEELSLKISSSKLTKSWEHLFSRPEFLRQFRSVSLRVLRVNPSPSSFVGEVGRYLQQDGRKEPITACPYWKEVEISMPRLRCWDKERCAEGEALAAFEWCELELAGRLVKVYVCKQTQILFRDTGSWWY